MNRSPNIELTSFLVFYIPSSITMHCSLLSYHYTLHYTIKMNKSITIKCSIHFQLLYIQLGVKNKFPPPRTLGELSEGSEYSYFSSSKRDRHCTSWKLGVKTRRMGWSGTDITLAFYYTRSRRHTHSHILRCAEPRSIVSSSPEMGDAVAIKVPKSVKRDAR